MHKGGSDLLNPFLCCPGIARVICCVNIVTILVFLFGRIQQIHSQKNSEVPVVRVDGKRCTVVQYGSRMRGGRDPGHVGTLAA